MNQSNQTNALEIQCLLDCIRTCTSCCHKCNNEEQYKLATLCHECVDVCHLAIKSLQCHSEFCAQLLDLCVQICRRCAQECEGHAEEYCKQCREVCNRCAEVCSNIYSYK